MHNPNNYLTALMFAPKTKSNIRISVVLLCLYVANIIIIELRNWLIVVNSCLRRRRSGCL